jgi:hypothetical protein
MRGKSVAAASDNSICRGSMRKPSAASRSGGQETIDRPGGPPDGIGEKNAKRRVAYMLVEEALIAVFFGGRKPEERN